MNIINILTDLRAFTNDKEICRKLIRRIKEDISIEGTLFNILDFKAKNFEEATKNPKEEKHTEQVSENEKPTYQATIDNRKSDKGNSSHEREEESNQDFNAKEIKFVCPSGNPLLICSAATQFTYCTCHSKLPKYVKDNNKDNEEDNDKCHAKDTDNSYCRICKKEKSSHESKTCIENIQAELENQSKMCEKCCQLVPEEFKKCFICKSISFINDFDITKIKEALESKGLIFNAIDNN